MKQRGFVLGILLTAVFVVILVVTGVVFLVVKARQATPSSWLYSIQAVGNRIELLLTPGREAKALVLLQLADHEVNSMVRLATEKEFEDVIEESRDIRRKLEDVREQVLEVESVGKHAGAIRVSAVNIAEKAIANLALAREQVSGANREKIVFEMVLMDVFMR